MCIYLNFKNSVLFLGFYLNIIIYLYMNFFKYHILTVAWTNISPSCIKWANLPHLAWWSFCFLLSSSTFLAFSAFCSSTSFLWAWTRLSRFRTKATSWRTSSLCSFLALSLVFLFSFSMALFSQRLEACRVSYSSFQAKFLRVQKLCQ